MPTKERYERDKAYYQAWNNSEKQAQASARKFKKRMEEGRCGSFATDYAEMAGYAPSEIGYAKVIVNDGNVVAVRKVVV